MEVPEEGFGDGEEPGDGDDEEGGESNNRNFLIIAVVLGGLILLTLICVAGFAVFYLPQRNAIVQQTNAVIAATYTQQALDQAATGTAAAASPTPLPTETPTLEPTSTPVINQATDTPTPGMVDPATATVEALETQLASINLTSTADAAAGGSATPTGKAGAGSPTPRATALSTTGFADEVGLPGLIILSIVLVAVILLARRLRQTPLAH